MVLACLGFIVNFRDPEPFCVEKWGIATDFLQDIWLHLGKVYSAVMSSPKVQQKAAECAKLAYLISIGEGATFEAPPWAKS
jgi:hypothetical protein